MAGGSGLVAADVDLDAGGVELCASGVISRVEGDDFVTENMSTVSEVGREVKPMDLSINCKDLMSVFD